MVWSISQNLCAFTIDAQSLPGPLHNGPEGGGRGLAVNPPYLIHRVGIVESVEALVRELKEQTRGVGFPLFQHAKNAGPVSVLLSYDHCNQEPPAVDPYICAPVNLIHAAAQHDRLDLPLEVVREHLNDL